MSHVRDYHAALARWRDDPIGLSDRDFAVIEEYGGPPQVARAQAEHTKALGIVAPVAAAPAGDRKFVTVALLEKVVAQMMDVVADGVGVAIKSHVWPRFAALETHLGVTAAELGLPALAPPIAATKPKLKFQGEWRRKMFAPGVGVQHGGVLWECVEPTFCEPSTTAASWRKVA